MPETPAASFAQKIPLAEWAYLHSHLIWIYDGAVDPEGRQGGAFAPHLTAWLLRAGSVELRVNDRHYAAKAGEWLFPPSGQVWRSFSDDARILSVRFRAVWPGGEELFSTGLGLPLRARDYPELERAARPLAAFVRREFPRPDRHLLNTPATLTAHLRLQSLFAQWLDVCVDALTRAGLVPSRMGHVDNRVLRAVQIIERQSLGFGFAERTLAAQVGLSVSQMNRLFVRQFGSSSRGYYERRRKEYALAALQGSDHTVKEIAFELGFSSLPHFSAWVKQHFGMTPSHLREQAGACRCLGLPRGQVAALHGFDRRSPGLGGSGWPRVRPPMKKIRNFTPRPRNGPELPATARRAILGDAPLRAECDELTPGHQL